MRKKYICLSLLILALTPLMPYLAARSISEDPSGNNNIKHLSMILWSYVDHRLATRVNTGGVRLVALTFDDGPDPAFTPGVLDILALYDIKATFFVTGQNVRQYPELVRAEIAAGHEVENHTYSHPDLRRLTEEQVSAEINRTQQAIAAVTGKKPGYFRPPRRLYDKRVMDVAQEQKLKMVLWTIGVENKACRTPERMAQRVLAWTVPGCIILAHDGDLDRSLTLQALPLIIEGFERQGYTFVTLEELFKAEVVN